MDQREPPLLGSGSGNRHSAGPLSSLLARVLTVTAGALVLIGGIAISIVVFAVVLVVVLAIGLYLWWKTRHVRKQLREQVQMRSPPPRPSPPFDGDVIEGEVIRKEESRPPRQ